AERLNYLRMTPIKLRVLRGDIEEVSKSRPVSTPRPPETIMFRGKSPDAPDLICGLCSATLATGLLEAKVPSLIGCSACGSVNEASTKR
ncbi:MAG: hypothetical protein ABI972_31055, partial [Acidobacteriota bacterium]